MSYPFRTVVPNRGAAAHSGAWAGNKGAAHRNNSSIITPIKPARGATKYLQYWVSVQQTKKSWETLLKDIKWKKKKRFKVFQMHFFSDRWRERHL